MKKRKKTKKRVTRLDRLELEITQMKQELSYLYSRLNRSYWDDFYVANTHGTTSIYPVREIDDGAGSIL